MAIFNRFELEPVIGFWLNTLILRGNLSGDPSFRELLGRVRDTALGAYAHQDLPLDKLVELLQPKRDPSRNPLFQVMFVMQLQNEPSRALGACGLTVTPLEIDDRTAKFDLTLSVAEEGDGFVGWFEYNTDLFDADTIVRMREHFLVLLAGIAADSEQY